MGKYYLVVVLLLVGAAALAQQQNDSQSTFVFKSAPDFIPTSDTNNFDWPGETTDETRISLSLDDAPLKDAVKSIFDQFHATYVIDKDVPEEARVTLHAKNLRVSTALDVVTQSANVGWALEPPTRTPGKTTDKNARGQYRITKEPRAFNSWSARLPLTAQLQALTTNSDRYTFTPGQLKDANASVWFAPQNNRLKLNQNSSDTYSNLVYELVAPEKRSTFTCPHCKGQVTIVRKPHTVKCPKCGRELQAGWQFCPNDGTKRPPDPGEWKFCPLCGKSIDVEN